MDSSALTFEEMMELGEDEVKEILGEYEAFKRERSEMQTKALEILPTIPNLLLDCIHYIRSNKGLLAPGVFRVNGDLAISREITETFKLNTDVQDVLLSFQQKGGLSIYDIASTIKSYFRRLKDPMMPIETYEILKEAVDEPSQDIDLLELINSSLDEIPEPNKSVLAYTMIFFQDLVAMSNVNKMSPSALATCLTMSLIRFKSVGDNPIAAIMEVQLCTKVLKLLLQNIDFTNFISKDRYFELLKSTKYRSEILPDTQEEFLTQNEQGKKFS